MKSKSNYTIKLDTKVGEVIIEDVIEYVFAKQYFYYSTKDIVNRIERISIYKAYRLLSGTIWIPINMKKFVNREKK